MKTKNLILAAIIMLSAASCQAASIITAMTGTAIIAAIPCGYYLYQGDGDIPKAKRLFRKDKDVAITNAIDVLHKNCKSDVCKKIERLLEQAKRTPSQLAEDTVADLMEAGKKTDVYQAADKLATENYNAAKKALDDLAKPRKE